MNKKNITLAGIFLLVLAFSITIVVAESSQDNKNVNERELEDDIQPYDGAIGPDNSLYGLKIAFENLGEGFTFNKTEKLAKQLEHARLRIAEAKAKLQEKNDEAVEKALEGYREKVNESEDLISELEDDDIGILNAEKMIAKHQLVLQRLYERHPNKGLERALNNSKDLIRKFEERHSRSRDDDKERENESEFRIKGKIIGNDTQVEIELKFGSDSVTNSSIAQEIVNRLRLSRENISSIIKIETEDETEKKLKEELTAKAEIKDNHSKIETEYDFILNETNSSEIIDGVYAKLQALTASDVLSVLKIKITEDDDDRKEDEDETEVKMQAKIIGNDAQIEVEAKFGSDSVTNSSIAQEIVNKLRLTRENISAMMKIKTEDETEEKLKEGLTAKAEIKDNHSKIETEYDFILNETNVSEIIDGVYAKLQALTTSDVLNVLRIKSTEDGDDRKDIQQERNTKEAEKSSNGEKAGDD